MNELQKTMRDSRAAELYPKSPSCRNAFRNGFRSETTATETLLDAPAIDKAFAEGQAYRKTCDQSIRDMLVRQKKEDAS